ncbi:hypothetical protein CKAH01_06839 [Colletotrichum kahawae]|uniref:CFEM domain-containing protein n=1 Tax=Colletotrichum kahawae TaxID=34407 RepID=A0AAD9Y832_COLKA|nr:hypothetical protein CKAH01_06839 [Colletotrichum kahawae]
MMKTGEVTLILASASTVLASEQLPACANGCLASIAKELGCSSANLSCLCAQSESLSAKMAVCIVTAGCGFGDIGSAAIWAPNTCVEVNSGAASQTGSSPSQTTGSAATTSALAPSPSATNSANRKQHTLGFPALSVAAGFLFVW